MNTVAESIPAAPPRQPPPPGLPKNGAPDKSWKLAELMRASQNGDRGAYATLLQELVPMLERWMRRRFWYVRATDRDDLLQDVLLSLHLAKARYDISRPFVPWFMSIAHNRVIDGIRRQMRWQTVEVLLDEFAESAAGATSQPVADEYGDPEALLEAVTHLPSRQRTAIELVKLRELSLKEAAAVTGMTTSALKVSVHRGVKNLRASLAPTMVAIQPEAMTG